MGTRKSTLLTPEDGIGDMVVVGGDLNKFADNDDVYKINIGVNGGFNGFQERITYSKKLIDLMNVKECPNLSLKAGKMAIGVSSSIFNFKP